MLSVPPSARAGGGGDRLAALTLLLRVCTGVGLRFPASHPVALDPADEDVKLGGVLDRLERIVPLRTVDYATFWAAVAVHAAEDGDASLLLPLLPHPRMAPPARLGDLFGVRSGPGPGPVPDFTLRAGLRNGDLAAIDAYLRHVIAGPARS